MKKVLSVLLFMGMGTLYSIIEGPIELPKTHLDVVGEGTEHTSERASQEDHNGYYYDASNGAPQDLIHTPVGEGEGSILLPKTDTVSGQLPVSGTDDMLPEEGVVVTSTVDPLSTDQTMTDQDVVTMLDEINKSFKNGSLNQSDAARALMPLYQMRNSFSPEVQTRLLQSFDVINKSSKSDWTVQPASKGDLPIPSVPANTAEDAIAFIAESVKKLVTTPARSNSTSSDDYYVLRKQIEDIEKSYSLTDDQHNILNRYYEILSAH